MVHTAPEKKSPVQGFPAGSGFFSTSETMAALGVCTRVTLNKYMRLGLLAPVAILGQVHVFSADEVQRARVELDEIREKRLRALRR